MFQVEGFKKGVRESRWLFVRACQVDWNQVAHLWSLTTECFQHFNSCSLKFLSCFSLRLMIILLFFLYNDQQVFFTYVVKRKRIFSFNIVLLLRVVFSLLWWYNLVSCHMLKVSFTVPWKHLIEIFILLSNKNYIDLIGFFVLRKNPRWYF